MAEQLGYPTHPVESPGMSSRGKIFVIHTKIKSESAWVDQQFLSRRRVTLYLKVAELMETCPQSVAFCKLEPTVNIENYYTRNTSNASK